MKTGILRTLKSTESYLSGRQLCEMLGVPRAAVWKAVGELREEGYVVEAVRSRGYRLAGDADVITQAELAFMLHTQWIGTRLEYLNGTGSTNIRTRKLVEEGVPRGILVVTDRRTIGKGRRGKGWVSPAGTGIWMSMVLKPVMSPMSTPMLTPVAGLSVVRGVKEDTGLETMIKWPNDAILNGKKTCGILTEISMEVRCIRYVIPGIGINIDIDDFPGEIGVTVASLRLEADRSIKRSLVITTVVDSFEYYYDIFMKACNVSGLRDDYNKAFVNLNKKVLMLDLRSQYKGEALGIDNEGSLLIRWEDGNISTVISGEVSVRGIYGYV